MDYGKSVKRQRLVHDYRVGDSSVVTIATYYERGSGSLTGTARNVTTGTAFVGIDPDRDTIGTCSSGCTTASIVDSSRTEATGFWQGVKVTLRDVSTGQEHVSRCTTSSNGSFSLNGFPVTPAAGDTYVIQYPLLGYVAAGTSGNNGTTSIGPTNLTMYSGEREIHYHADFGTDEEWYEFEFKVLE